MSACIRYRGIVFHLWLFGSVDVPADTESQQCCTGMKENRKRAHVHVPSGIGLNLFSDGGEGSQIQAGGLSWAEDVIFPKYSWDM